MTDPGRPRHAVEHVGHDLGRGVQAPVTGALHGVVELGVVVGGQFDLGGEVKQPDLDHPVHLRTEPRLGPARRGLQAGPGRHDGGDQDEGGQRGPDPLGRGPRREQRLEDAVGGQQGETGEHSGDQVQPDGGDRIAPVRLQTQPDGVADQPGQLPRHRAEAGLGQPPVVGLPVESPAPP
jgi:hypothetical protein